MEELYMTKIVRVGTSKAIIVPVNVLDGLGWQRGDRVLFTFAGHDQLIVRKVDDETIKQLKATREFNDTDDSGLQTIKI